MVDAADLKDAIVEAVKRQTENIVEGNVFEREVLIVDVVKQQTENMIEENVLQREIVVCHQEDVVEGNVSARVDAEEIVR